MKKQMIDSQGNIFGIGNKLKSYNMFITCIGLNKGFGEFEHSTPTGKKTFKLNQESMMLSNWVVV